MITFKAFIQEELAPDAEPLKYTQLTLDEALEHLKTDFSDCFWMVEKNMPFYRGETKYVTDGYAIVDPSTSKRVSQNTTNYYTLIFDNHPRRKKLPLRSKSIICTTSRATARNYDDEPLIIIPSNSSRIGFANAIDMWNTVITLFGFTDEIAVFNERFSTLHLSDDNWADWEEYDRKLKSGDQKLIDKFYSVFPHAADHKSFLESIFDAYSVSNTGHTVVSAGGLTPGDMKIKSEVWIDGPCLVITKQAWDDIT